MVRAAVLLACCCALPASAQQAQTLDNAQLAAKFAATASAAPEVPFFPPTEADEWYTVTIANVSVGYMHTTVATMTDRVQTMEVMDVQVSRGVDTSRMAFETIFEETLLEVAAPELVGGSELSERTGGVKIMAYDQRFANSEVKMNASIDEQKGVTLVSYNGEKAHTSDLDLPEEAWLGRMRARLAFTKRCRLGETKITVQTAARLRIMWENVSRRVCWQRLRKTKSTGQPSGRSFLYPSLAPEMLLLPLINPGPNATAYKTDWKKPLASPMRSN